MAEFEVYPGGPKADPFGKMSAGVLRDFVGSVGLQLTVDPKVRVEVWFDSDNGLARGVRKPFAEIMVGVPNTTFRVSRIFALPTWASPGQVAGLLRRELDDNIGDRWAKIKQFFGRGPRRLMMKGDPGLYEVKIFSTLTQNE